LNMADNKEQVTSTTTSFGDELVYRADFNGVVDVNEAAAKESFDVDDIVDLVGGAQDAIYRHIAEESALKEDPEPELYRPASEPEAEPEAQTFSGLVDVSMPPPVVSESDSTTTTTTVTEEPTPLSDTLVVSPSYEPVVVVEPESTQIVPPAEPQVAPPPRPVSPELTLPTPAAPPAAAAAAAAAPPIREEEAPVAPVAPASCKRFHINQTVIE